MLDYNETFSFELEMDSSVDYIESLGNQEEKINTVNHSIVKKKKPTGIEILKKLKRELINSNFSNNREDLEDLALHFKQLLNKNPFDVDLTISLGNCLQELMQLNRAKRLYSRFDFNKRGSSIIFNKLANIFFEEENYEKAKKYYEKVLIIDSHQPEKSLYIKLLYCCEKLKKFDYGLSIISKAKNLRSVISSPDISLLYGNIYFGSRRYNKAIQQYQEGLNNLSTYEEAIIDIIKSSKSKIQIDQKIFQKALKINSPKFIETKLLNNLGNTLNKIGNYKQAKKILERSVTIAPLPYALNNLALSMKSLGDLEGALINLSKALALQPKSASINYNLAETFILNGNENKAIEYFKRTLVIDKKNVSAKYKLNVLLGKKPILPPEGYITNLFEKYSETFDIHLLKSLKYKVPKEILKYIKQHFSTDHKFRKVLDLGCGTGLCGSLIMDYCNEIIGVDLSKKMLLKAKNKSVYTNLINAEINEYLKISKSKFDLITAGDVLIYIGQLENLFQHINRVLKNGGLFIFSTEKLNIGEYKANVTGRFSHNKKYVTKIVEKNGWVIEKINQINIRKENHAWVKGELFIILKK